MLNRPLYLVFLFLQCTCRSYDNTFENCSLHILSTHVRIPQSPSSGKQNIHTKEAYWPYRIILIGLVLRSKFFSHWQIQSR